MHRECFLHAVAPPQLRSTDRTSKKGELEQSQRVEQGCGEMGCGQGYRGPAYQASLRQK